jgi:hypothetical protein
MNLLQNGKVSAVNDERRRDGLGKGYRGYGLLGIGIEERIEGLARISGALDSCTTSHSPLVEPSPQHA